VEGPLLVSALRAALNMVVARHETLRTTFEPDEQHLYQYVRPPTDVNVLHERAGTAEHAAMRAEQLARRPIDFSSPPLCHAAVVSVNDDLHFFSWGIHHIANDGWSMALLHDDLAAGYAAALGGARLPAARSAFAYADYAVWEQERAEAGEFDSDLGYWTAFLRDVSEPLSLRDTASRPSTQSFSGSRLHITTSPGTQLLVRDFALRHRATTFAVILTAFASTIASRTAANEIVIGAVTAGRTLDEVDQLVGPFTNLVPIRLPLHVGKARVTDASERFVTAMGREVPFELLVDRVAARRSSAYNPIVQASVSSHQGLGSELRLENTQVSTVPTRQVDVHEDLTLYVRATDSTLSFDLDYAGDLFEQQYVDAFAADLVGELAALAGEADETGAS
jgi:hypothetical protein